MDKHILTSLADNPSLLSAVRKLLEDKFSTDSLKADHADEVLGQMVRARLVGLKAIEEAFQEIARHRSTSDHPERINPGM